jgi:hypothetical protein
MTAPFVILNLLVITFLTTLTPLARVVLRNDASPLDGDNRRLVCVRGDQCHDLLFRQVPLQLSTFRLKWNVRKISLINQLGEMDPALVRTENMLLQDLITALYAV